MLTLSYLDITGPGPCVYKATSPEIGGRLSLELELGNGVPSQSRAVEAAQQLAADALRYLDITVEPSADPADYPPTPAPTSAEQTAAELLEFYEERQRRAPSIIARWGAYNHVKLTTGAWAYSDFQTLRRHPKAVDAEMAVRQGSWGEAYAILSSFTTEDHPLADTETVAAYLAAMVAEGFVPAT